MSVAKRLLVRWQSARLRSLSRCSLQRLPLIQRYFSSRSEGQGGFRLDALPFSVSPEEALEKFRDWAEGDQGLRYLLSYNSVRIGAAYVPVWSFDLNVRFGTNWKPPMFSVYQEDTVYIPGLSTYAGYSYRRSLINPVHSTSLVFLGEQTQPFGGWMLREMTLKESGLSVSVIPDAWNATEATALSILLEDLQSIVDDSWPSETLPPRVKVEAVGARRVFMPTFTIEYSILGLEYRAFVSGCDLAAPVAGVSHQIFGQFNLFQSPEFHQQSRNFLAWSSSILRLQNLPFLLRILRPALTLGWFGLLRIWSSIPIIGAASGILAGYRKVLQPWMDARSASAEWERQREHEGKMNENVTRRKNDFADLGRARQYFFRNKQRILEHLSGPYRHEEGGFDQYQEWRDWAEKQWKQREQNSQQQSQQKDQRRWRQQQENQEYHWDFDKGDPYAVLGIQRGATKQQVSEAFRKQMLKYHPDTQPNATELQKKRLVERSKLITEAYRKVKSQLK